MRKTLAEEHLSPEASRLIENFHSSIVDEVIQTIGENRVVVVGMALNPFVLKAKNALTKKNISFRYLEYGGYSSKWKERLAIKIWSGWPTFPQIFLDGKLVGGFQELKRVLDDGKMN